MLLKLKGVPLEVVGWLVRRPLSALRLPFFGDLKKRNSDGFVPVFRVSRKACIMKAKRTGEALSPCCTPVLF